MTGDNSVKTVVATKQTDFGTVTLLRTEFDVCVCDLDGKNIRFAERSVSWQVLGVGINSLGRAEADARHEFAQH